MTGPRWQLRPDANHHLTTVKLLLQLNGFTIRAHGSLLTQNQFNNPEWLPSLWKFSLRWNTQHGDAGDPESLKTNPQKKGAHFILPLKRDKTTCGA